MRKCLILHAALLLAIAVLVGCGDRKDAGAGKTITLGLSYDSLESAWLVVNHRAVTEEAQRRGRKLFPSWRKVMRRSKTSRLKTCSLVRWTRSFVFPRTARRSSSRSKTAGPPGFPL